VGDHLGEEDSRGKEVKSPNVLPPPHEYEGLLKGCDSGVGSLKLGLKGGRKEYRVDGKEASFDLWRSEREPAHSSAHNWNVSTLVKSSGGASLEVV